MSRLSSRLVLPLLGLALIAGGVATVLRGTAGGAEAASGNEYVIDILPDSFNPPTCVVNRNDSVVRFRNKDSKPRRMIRLDVTTEPTAPFLDDTGWIAPGEVSVWNIELTTVADYVFRDFDNRNLTVHIIAPISNNAAAACDQVAPTPTPTPKPSPTPPVQRPPACTGLAPVSRQPVTGCGVAANLARDDEDVQP